MKSAYYRMIRTAKKPKKPCDFSRIILALIASQQMDSSINILILEQMIRCLKIGLVFQPVRKEMVQVKFPAKIFVCDFFLQATFAVSMNSPHDWVFPHT